MMMTSENRTTSQEEVRLYPVKTDDVTQDDNVAIAEETRGSRKSSIYVPSRNGSRVATPAPVSEERPKKKKKTRGIELPVRAFKSRSERDPDFMNQDLRVNFTDVIAEPEGYYTPKFSWNLSQELYGFGKGCCYSVSTLVCGIPAAFLWGIIFSVLACFNVWCLVPIRRLVSIKMSIWGTLWAVLVSSCCDPFYKSFGMIFNNVSVRTEKHIV